MKRIHYISGLTITIFVVLHLTNHLFSLAGADAHISLMDSLRSFYRNPFAESILLIAVMVQIVSGIKLFIKKKKEANKLFDKLQIWSGFYIALFFLIHLSAVLIGRYVLKLDTNFYFGIAGLNTFPFNLFFIPYYALAIIAFFTHISAVHYKKMTKHIFGLSPISQSYLILVFGIVLTLILMYGLTNSFSGYEIPPAYNVLIGK